MRQARCRWRHVRRRTPRHALAVARSSTSGSRRTSRLSLPSGPEPQESAMATPLNKLGSALHELVGDLEDVSERIAHHRTSIAVRSIEWILQRRGPGADGPLVDLVRVID